VYREHQLWDDALRVAKTHGMCDGLVWMWGEFVVCV
jgi:hypothetical protein